MKGIDERIPIIVKACNDKRGFDVKILDIKELTTIADYFIIVSGNSTTQVMAIADEIEEKMAEEGFECLGKEGYREGMWILMDFGNVVVHVFHKDQREFYNLEKVWADSFELILEGM